MAVLRFLVLKPRSKQLFILLQTHYTTKLKGCKKRGIYKHFCFVAVPGYLQLKHRTEQAAQNFKLCFAPPPNIFASIF